MTGNYYLCAWGTKGEFEPNAPEDIDEDFNPNENNLYIIGSQHLNKKKYIQGLSMIHMLVNIN